MADAMARPEEQALQSKLETPLVNLPQELYTAPVLEWLDPQMAEGMAAGTKRAVEGMTSPAGLATVPYMAVGGAEAAALNGASVAGRIIAGAFGVQGVAQLPEAGRRYVEAVGKGDKQAAAAAWVDLAAGSAMVLGGAAGVQGLKGALERGAEVSPPPILPRAEAAFQELIPEERRLMAPRMRMPEFTESTMEPQGPPLKALPAPGEASGDVLLPESTEAPRTTGYRIQLPVEPETAKAARQVWSKPIDVEAEVEGVDALRQLASMTGEEKTPGKPYNPPTVNVDLRQLERMMQRNTVSRVESWADEVIQNKLKGTSSNPFLDPELLAAAAAKGAILFKRGVTKAAEWNAAMREQFGRGLEDKLPMIYQQSKDYWERRVGNGEKGGINASGIEETTAPVRDVLRSDEGGTQAPSGVPESVNEGGEGVRGNENQAPSQPKAKVSGADLPTEPSVIYRAVQGALEPLRKMRAGAQHLWENWDVREKMAVTKDAADNQARIVGREVANDVRGEMRRTFGKEQDVAEEALSFVVESKGEFDNLDAMRERVLDSTEADQHWKRKAAVALDFARDHWEELEPISRRYTEYTDAQVAEENASGIDTLRRQGYVMHAQDMDESVLGGGGEPTRFRKVRTYDTFADSIAAGVNPRSLNAVDLMESRVAAGQRMINNRAWLAGLKDLRDASGNPLSADPITVKRSDGSSYQEAPQGYHMESLGRTPVAIRDGFEEVFRALTDPSMFTRSLPGKLLMQGAGGTKSLVLAIDTFHLGRIAFWDSLIKALGIKTFKLPFPSYKKGVTLLDMTPEEIRKMGDSGEIPKEWLPQLEESKRQLDLVLKSGFNVGRISDALYNDVIHSIPILGRFNKFLFDQFQRGAMAESWLLEFDRLRRARPEMPEAEAARVVTKDLNTRFGNLGRQGLLKSKSFQDAARLFALAPQWNEGLIRSEVGAMKQAEQFVVDSAQGKRFYAGLLLRSVAGMALAQFTANQLINLATRGKPTWENPEEGLGSKVSAWIPDLIGTGPGFFLHPLGLAAETTHLLINAYERTGDFQKTLNQYLRSRASVAMRPVLVWMTNTDFLGRTLKPGTALKEALKEAAPVPIGGAGYVSAAKQVYTGKESETFPGQIQKQMMSSLGVKTEQAPGPGQRISKLAQEYNEAHNIKRPQWQGPVSDYAPLSSALRIGNMDAAKDAMDELLKTHKAGAIAEHFQIWARSPFTGRRAQEGGFVRSLNQEQAQVYQQARKERVEVSRKALALLRESVARARAAEANP